MYGFWFVRAAEGRRTKGCFVFSSKFFEFSRGGVALELFGKATTLENQMFLY
jgi:hypothetical protein